jgi:hypothetical protein
VLTKLHNQDSHIIPLSKLSNLTDLSLSSDFEELADDPVLREHDKAWHARCYTRRLKATEDIAKACFRLQRCKWVQLGVDHSNRSMDHPFIVVEERRNLTTVRVVRGVKQGWMGMDDVDPLTGATVKGKLEDLPGNIIDLDVKVESEHDESEDDEDDENINDE